MGEPEDRLGRRNAMADDGGADGGGRARTDSGGPRAWVVLLGTAVAAAAVIGGVVGFRAWRGGDEAAPGASAVPVTGPAAADGGDGSLLFRRTTAGGIEVRAQLVEENLRGGIFIDPVPVPLATAPGSAPDDPGGAATTSDERSTASAGAAPPADAGPDDAVSSSDATAPATTALAPADAPRRARPVADDVPAVCRVVGNLTAWAISDERIAQGGAPWTQAVPDGLHPSLMWDGAGQPGAGDESIVGVALQVADDVTSVRLTTPIGVSDEMAPVEGAVVLAVLVPAEAAQDLFGAFGPAQRAGPGEAYQVTAQRADASVVTASLADAIEGQHPAWGPECQRGMVIEEPAPVPTIALPAAGAEQPADPAAARAEIEHHIALLYGERDPAVDRSQYIDDDYGFADVSAEVDRRFGEAASAATVEVEELVFADATNAVFRYTLRTPVADFGGQLGRARLVDGVWKITRGTLCQDMAHAGGICPP